MTEIAKYKGQDDIFISFTHDVGASSHRRDGSHRLGSGVMASGNRHNLRGSKIGINPKNEYGTPTAIYTYPVNYVVENQIGEYFASERPYIIVVRRKTNRYLDLSMATSEDYQRVCDVLAKKYGLSEEQQHEWSNEAKNSKNVFGSRIWYLTKKVAENEHLGRLKKLFLRDNPEFNNIREKPKWPGHGADEEAIAAFKAAHDAWTNDYEAMGEWQAYSDAFDSYQAETSSRHTSVWNKVLRDCGFECIIDPGLSIIHENEPTQAIFLQASALEIVEVIHNRKPSTTERWIANRMATDKSDEFIKQVRLGNYPVSDIHRVLVRNRALFVDIVEYLPDDHIDKILKEDPVIFSLKGLPDSIYSRFPDIDAREDDMIFGIRAVPDHYVVERIIKNEKFRSYVTYYGQLYRLGPLSQRAMANLDPMSVRYAWEHARSDNKKLFDDEALKLAGVSRNESPAESPLTQPEPYET